MLCEESFQALSPCQLATFTLQGKTNFIYFRLNNDYNADAKFCVEEKWRWLIYFHLNHDYNAKGKFSLEKK